ATTPSASSATGPTADLGTTRVQATDIVNAPSHPGVFFVPASVAASGPFIAQNNLPDMRFSSPVPAAHPLSTGARMIQASEPYIPEVPQMWNPYLSTSAAQAQMGTFPQNAQAHLAKGTPGGPLTKFIATSQAKVLAVILVTVLTVSTGAAVVLATQ